VGLNGLADRTREVLEDFDSPTNKDVSTTPVGVDLDLDSLTHVTGNSQHPSPNLRNKQIYYHINLLEI